MGLFDCVSGGQGQTYDPQQRQLMERDVRDVKANPAAFLKARGMNIPDGMTDAQQITQYLLRTGQVGSPRLRQVMSMLGMGSR